MSALDRLFAVHKPLDQASQVVAPSSAGACPSLTAVVTATFAQEVDWNPLIQQIGRNTSLSIWRALRLLHKHSLLPVKILDSIAEGSMSGDGEEDNEEEKLQEQSRVHLMNHLTSIVLPQVSLLTEPLHPNMLLESSVALSLAISLGWPLMPPDSEVAMSAERLALVPAAVLSSSSSSLPSSTMGLEHTQFDPMGSLLGAILDSRPVSSTSSSSSSEATFNRRSRGAVLYQRLRGDINAYLLKTHVLPGVVGHLLSSSSSTSSSLSSSASSISSTGTSSMPKHPIEGGSMVFYELASHVLVSGPSTAGGIILDGAGAAGTVGPREFLNATMPHVDSLAPLPTLSQEQKGANYSSSSVATLRILLDCCQQV